MSWVRALLFLPAGASTFADGVDLLHLAVISVTMLAAVGLAAQTLYYMIRFRRSSPNQTTQRMSGSRFGEATIIGAILATFLLFWGIGFAQYVRIETPPDDALTFYVTAKQWVWKFSGAGGRRAINVLTVPVCRPIKLVMTSRDVIHSFYVPAFRIKQDVIPGRYVTAWFQATQPGDYDLYCAEYCGVSHSRMLGTVSVLAQADYDAWLARDSDTDTLSDEGFIRAGGDGRQEGADLALLGGEIAASRQCLACHTLDGQRHIGPTWLGLYGSTITLANGRKVLADEAYLTRSMMEPNADVHAGFRAVMPTYQGVLSAPEVAALLEYIKSLRAAGPASGVELPALEGTTLPGGSSAEPRTNDSGLGMGERE